MHVLPREAADLSESDEGCLLHASPFFILGIRLARETPGVHLDCGEACCRFLYTESWMMVRLAQG